METEKPSASPDLKNLAEKNPAAVVEFLLSYYGDSEHPDNKDYKELIDRCVENLESRLRVQIEIGNSLVTLPREVSEGVFEKVTVQKLGPTTKEDIRLFDLFVDTLEENGYLPPGIIRRQFNSGEEIDIAMKALKDALTRAVKEYEME